jgi:outer membrane receptor protein involved in Fe transport
MKKPPRTLLPALACLALAGQLAAQTAPAAKPATTGATADTILLNPFEVSTGKDTGYVAGSSLAGGRAETPLALTPASISVMTREFIDDLNIIGLEEAVKWTASVMPGNENQNQTAFGSFQFNFRNTGGSQNYPTRNYFLFYANSDTYNTERFEFARGPNSLLFGDAALGGVSTNFTKQARFNQQRHEFRLQGDSDGGWRSALDSQWGNRRFGVRVNGLMQRNDGWRDGTYENRDGVHVALGYKLGENTQLRAEHETLSWNMLLYRTTYADNVSFWDRTTVNAAATHSLNSIANAVNFGVEQFGGNPYYAYAPAIPSAGTQDYRWAYRSRGTGFAIKPEGRSDIAQFPRLPSRKFNLGPNDADQIRALGYHAVYLDQRVTRDWFAQLAYFRMDHDAEARNTESLAGNHYIDVNRFLPNGQANPKFGVPFSDIDQNIQYQDNRVEDVRLLTTYKFELPKFLDLKQRFSVIGGFRPERFEMWQRRMRWINNPAVPNVNNVANQLRYRLYWDEPLRYGAGSNPPPFTPPAGAPTPIFRYADIGFGSKEHKDLTYAQVVSSTTLFNDRISLLSGVRTDTLKRRIRQQIGNDPVTGYTIYGGFNPAIKANQAGYEQNEKVTVTSSNIGLVGYVLPWLALQANYSENFGLPTTGVNKYNGAGFNPTRGKGKDFGLKFSLPNNKLYAVLTRYDSEQVERIIGGGNIGNIQNIWRNLGDTTDDKIGFNYRDTEDIEATGWEFEVVTNAIPNFTFTANWARPDATIIQQRPGQQAYFDANIAEWNRRADALALTNAALATTVRNDIQAVRTTLEGIARGATNNNTFKNSVNFYGSYNARTGPLKGLNIGGGGNWRDKRKVGSVDGRLKFNVATATPTQVREAAFDYLYAPSTFEASMHVNYELRLAQRYRTRLQLNVSNLTNNRDLVITGYGTYNVGGVGTGRLIQTDNNFYYLNPRKFTLSTIVSF